MKRFLLTLCAAVIIASPLVADKASAQEKKPEPASAQDDMIEVAIRVAVLDVDAIRVNSSAVKDIHAQLQKYSKAYEEEINKERETLEKASKSLQQKKTLLAPEAFNEERRKFEQRVIDVQRLVQIRKQDLERARGLAMQNVVRAMNKVIVEYANKGGFTLILRKNQTVLAHPALDVTGDILKNLNKELPKVKVPDPAKPVAAKAKKSGK